MSSDSQLDNQGQQLFNNIKGEQSASQNNQVRNQFNEAPNQSSQQEKPKNKKIKKLKKQKKHKKDKKKKHHKKAKKQQQLQQYDEEDQESANPYGDFFEGEADEDDEDQQQLMDQQNQINDLARDKYQQQLYKRRSSDYLQRFKGKDDDQINRHYSHKVLMQRQFQVMMPGPSDPKTYMLIVKNGKQEDLVYNILNKARHLKDKEKKVTIVSALAMKKKFPGKIFVQAYDQKSIKQSFQDFIDINLGKIQIFDNESYRNLFGQKKDDSIAYHEGDFIRIKKGLYEQDLGKILKMKKNSVDVVLVPRVNLQDVIMKMKQQTSQMTQVDKIQKRKQEILKQFFNHRLFVPKNMRPSKKPLYHQDFRDILDIPYSQKIKLVSNGLILYSFRYDEIMKPKGTFLPIQLQYFSKEGRIVDQFQNQKKHFVSAINFSKGDDVDVYLNENEVIHGKIVQVKQKTASIKIRAKQNQSMVMEYSLQQLAKRFKQGQKVKVISGSNKGKTGVILKIDGKFAQIWTQNQNTIKVNKNNLEIHTGQVICQENIHNLKKDDLIKTSKNNVGIVLATRKDNFKILDINNTIQVISNLDFDSKINSKALATKNRMGQLIKNQATVRILKGMHEGQRCQVKHVYKEFVFVFNEKFDKTGGISVQKADNLSIISKNNQINHRNFQKSSNANYGGMMGNQGAQEQLVVGKTIILKSGPLKGYQGVIRTVNKDRIEVRVPSKGCTQWVQRQNVTSGQQSNDFGKTPHRGPSLTNQYAPSPAINQFF